MAKREVFFSFEYKKDCQRAAKVRNMGKVDDSSTFSDNDWEEVKSKDDETIKKWIDNQLSYRSVLVVLIGETTYSRKWVKYEIQKAYELGKGLVGIYIHNLEDLNGNQTDKGPNPFSFVKADDGKYLSEYVECYNPPYALSKNVYNDISDKIEGLIERAYKNSGTY